MRVIFALLIVTSCLVAVKSYYNAALLYGVHKCSRYQSDLEICIKRSIESMKSYLKTGILDIPSIDNYVIESYEFEWNIPEYQFTPISGHMLLTRLYFSGLLDYTIRQVKVSPDMRYIEFEAYFPLIKLNAIYDIDAVVEREPFIRPLIPIKQSEKPMNANFTDVTATIMIIGDYYENHKNMEYFQLSTVIVYFNVLSYNTAFILTEKYPQISDQLSASVNRQWPLVEQQLKRRFQADAGEIIKENANKIYKRFTTNVLMPF